MTDKHLKTKKLTNVDVSEFLVSNNIRDQTKLMAIAKDRHSAGEKDLYRFIISRSSKSLSQLIDMTWKINNASSELEREQQSRISILKKYLEPECAAGCNGQWLVCAKQALQQNGINLYYFALSLRQLLEKGRQKRLNILLIGPTNCGKSFLLNPLEIM